MRRLFLAIVGAVLLTPASALAGDDIPVAELISDPASYDVAAAGEISVRGELIGDYQRRSDAVWVQLNGDSYVDRPVRDGGPLAGGNVGVGARIPNEVFTPLEGTSPGGYRVRGPIVEVTGVWLFHDPDRGGESYFDVASVVVFEPDRALGDDTHWWALFVGLALVALGVIPLLRGGRGD